MLMPSHQPPSSSAEGALRGSAPRPATLAERPQPAPHHPGSGAGATWRSADLLGAHTEVQIDHHGAIYRLRLTALGKLILTK